MDEQVGIIQQSFNTNHIGYPMAMKLPRLRINKTWSMLFVAVALAFLATLLTTRYIKGREEHIAAEAKALAQQGGATVSVVVPTRDLPAGAPLNENVVAARQVAADLVYPDAILASDFKKYNGQQLIRAVLVGRPLLKTDLHALSTDFSGTLPVGMRAMTVDVDELNSVAHLVQPGNRIDLMLTMRRDGGGQTVVPFMDRMKVLAAGQRLDRGGEDKESGNKGSFSYANLTLEVTAVQAARLTLAQDIGKLRIVLRNENDMKSDSFSVNSQNIFGQTSMDDPIAKRRMMAMNTTMAKVHTNENTVEFIIGGQRSGPNAKSLNMPVSGGEPDSTIKVPAIAPPGGVAAAATPDDDHVDSNGLTQKMKAELKTLIEK
jgi:pilus assembly protein CpaB